MKKGISIIIFMSLMCMLSGCSRYPTQGVPGVASVSSIKVTVFFLIILVSFITYTLVKIIKQNSKH